MTAREQFAILALILSGCGGSGPARRGGEIGPPSEAVQVYAGALRAGDARSAYDLMSADARSRVGFEAFSNQMRDNREELRAEADRVAIAGRRGVAARARAQLASGEQVRLILEDGEWRLEGGVLGAPTLRTPADAIEALRQALLRRSLAELERVLARQVRAEIASEIARIVEATADPLDLQIEVQGNVARVRTSDGGEIVLVREAGEWHVSEIR